MAAVNYGKVSEALNYKLDLDFGNLKTGDDPNAILETINTAADQAILNVNNTVATGEASITSTKNNAVDTINSTSTSATSDITTLKTDTLSEIETTVTTATTDINTIKAEAVSVIDTAKTEALNEISAATADLATKDDIRTYAPAIYAITMTSGTVNLEANKVYSMSIDGNTTFSLPTEVNNNVFNQIKVIAEVTGVPVIDWGTLEYFNKTAPEIEAGSYDFYFDYNPIKKKWTAGALPKGAAS